MQPVRLTAPIWSRITQLACLALMLLVAAQLSAALTTVEQETMQPAHVFVWLR
jgi:hypothetical protein